MENDPQTIEEWYERLQTVRNWETLLATIEAMAKEVIELKKQTNKPQE